MRWLIIDEISAVALFVLGALEGNTRRACGRQRYARRKNGTPRPFGGMNIVFCGDWWQLPPVKASAMFSNPFVQGYTHAEQRIQGMFWRREADSVTHVFELTEEHRFKNDAWLKEVLQEHRHGNESWEVS